jgi:hypothetical protein
MKQSPAHTVSSNQNLVSSSQSRNLSKVGCHAKSSPEGEISESSQKDMDITLFLAEFRESEIRPDGTAATQKTRSTSVTAHKNLVLLKKFNPFPQLSRLKNCEHQKLPRTISRIFRPH